MASDLINEWSIQSNASNDLRPDQDASNDHHSHEDPLCCLG